MNATNVRRFVLVDLHAPLRAPKASAMRLHPIAWGRPDPALARGCGASLLTTTPKFRFNRVRAVLRPLVD